jgi:CubicO group peptidase (beta-lactamase class C family)
MDSEARIQAALTDAVAANGLVGAVAAARLPDGGAAIASAGLRALGDTQPMTPDTLFWIASCTKAITSAAVLQLVEDGRVGLDEPLGERLPDVTAPQLVAGFDAAGAPILRAATQPVTARRLLSHTAGYGYDFCNETLTRYTAAIGGDQRSNGRASPLLFEPGAGWTYGVNTDWAGELVTAVTGEGLDAYLARRVFGPLGMTETTFSPNEAQRGRSAAMHARGPDGQLGPFEFGMPSPPYFGMGGGGLYSTAGDYLKFLDAILAGGAPILGPQGYAGLTEPQWEGEEVGVLPPVNGFLCAGYDPFPGEAKRWSLGFLMNAKAGPNGRSAGSLAWGGLGNCYYWADPARKTAGVFLAQHFPFGDPAALAAFGAFERAVYGA